MFVRITQGDTAYARMQLKTSSLDWGNFGLEQLSIFVSEYTCCRAFCAFADFG